MVTKINFDSTPSSVALVETNDGNKARASVVATAEGQVEYDKTSLSDTVLITMADGTKVRAKVVHFVGNTPTVATVGAVSSVNGKSGAVVLLPEDIAAINADASTYALTSLSSLFSSSRARLAKIYQEPRMPTLGTYTIFSFGWAYTDSQNAPALMAIEWATGRLYFYQGLEADCEPSAWQQFSFGDHIGDSDALIANYQSHYGITAMEYGLPTIIAGNKIKMPGGMKVVMPGSEYAEVALASPETYTMVGTTNCTLFYGRSLTGMGSGYLEATSVYYSRKPPADNGIDGFQAWKAPGQNWKFRSNDTGNVWREYVAGPLMDCKFNDEGVLVRIDFIGYRLLDKQEFGTKLPAYPTEGKHILACENGVLSWIPYTE